MLFKKWHLTSRMFSISICLEPVRIALPGAQTEFTWSLQLQYLLPDLWASLTSLILCSMEHLKQTIHHQPDEGKILDLRKELKVYSDRCDSRAAPTDQICLLSTVHCTQHLEASAIMMTRRAALSTSLLGIQLQPVTSCECLGCSMIL